MVLVRWLVRCSCYLCVLPIVLLYWQWTAHIVLLYWQWTAHIVLLYWQWTAHIVSGDLAQPPVLLSEWAVGRLLGLADCSRAAPSVCVRMR